MTAPNLLATQDLHDLGVHALQQALQHKQVSAVELATHLLARARTHANLGAYVDLQENVTLEQARAADNRISRGEARLLEGIPIAHKDIFVTRDFVSTAGSRMLDGYLSPFDATVVANLAQAGTVTLGKLNCDEFAMGSSTEASAYQTTGNPWDLSRVPGGSSGGSAAAVASGQALGTLGTDTGGSIRQPAALCGVSGLKPTYGRVSRYGLIAYGSSLDQIGPLAQTAADLAMILQVLAGHDPRDGTSAAAPVPDYRAALSGDVRGLRVGVPSEYFVEGMEPGVEQATRAAIAVLRERGAEVIEISLPYTKYALPTYYIIAPAEASANLARFDGVRYGPREPGDSMWDQIELTRGHRFGAEVRRRIMLGAYTLSAGYYDAYYKRAQQVRTLIKRDFEIAFAKVDIIAAPTSPTVAFLIGQKTDNPLAMYLSDVCTLPINLAGVPGLVVPCGFSEGLPVGLQLIGRPFDEASLLRAGDAYQRETDWHTRRPQL